VIDKELNVFICSDTKHAHLNVVFVHELEDEIGFMPYSIVVILCTVSHLDLRELRHNINSMVKLFNYKTLGFIIFT
jgi:hypothetical protein